MDLHNPHCYHNIHPLTWDEKENKKERKKGCLWKESHNASWDMDKQTGIMVDN